MIVANVDIVPAALRQDHKRAKLCFEGAIGQLRSAYALVNAADKTLADENVVAEFAGRLNLVRELITGVARELRVTLDEVLVK